MGFYGWLRHLVAVDKRGVVWGIVLVIGVELVTRSRTLVEVEAVLVVVTLVALWGVSRASRGKG